MVGRGGCDAWYFMERMGLDEAMTYVEGLRLRSRDEYNCTRLLANVVHHVLTGKDLDWTFPWEEGGLNVEELTDAEVEAARERARAAEAWMAARKAAKNGRDGDTRAAMYGRDGDAEGEAKAAAVPPLAEKGEAKDPPSKAGTTTPE